MLDVNDFDQLQMGKPPLRTTSGRGRTERFASPRRSTTGPCAEKDGLFCEKIFGPTKDWECYCRRVQARPVPRHHL